MLNKGQKKRLLLIIAAPLIAAGIWLSSGGYKNFVSANVETYCYQSGECIGLYSDTSDVRPEAGIHLNNAFSNARLWESLNETIVLAKPNTERTLIVPTNINAGAYGCSLQYFPNYQEPTTGVGTSTPQMKDIFTLDCGDRSLPAFRFKQPSVQENFKLLFSNNTEVGNRLSSKMRALSLFSFFIPSILFLGILVALKAIGGAYRYVKSGKAE